MPSRKSPHYTRRWRRLRLQIFDRDGYRCRKCGKPGRLEAHHIVPVTQGGLPFEQDNILTYCRGCHIEHHRQADPARRAWLDFVRDLTKTIV